jgi:hypothetical protein
MTRAFPVKRYPANPITPHGSYWFLSGKKPMMTYQSYDGTSVFHLMGGMAIPDMVNAPESIRIMEMSGLIPPWQPIEQKGATQDGVSFIDALYDPIDGDMTVEARGKTPARTAALIRDWIAAWDAKQPGELSFFDQYAGRWWAPVRWTRNPVDKLMGKKFTRQTFTWPFKSHDAFWRSYDNVDSFAFAYQDFTDIFDDDTEAAGNLGPDWPLRYDEPGGGFLYSDGSSARWKDDPDDWLITETREVVAGPRRDFSTAGDNQVVTMVMGTLQEWSLPEGAANDVWVRMGRNPDGTWDGNGVRLRMENNILKLSRFNDFIQTVMRHRIILIPPIFGEKFTLVAGYDGDPRLFKVQRNGVEIMSFKESGTGSMLGPDYRGVGFGMQAGAAVVTQATPAAVKQISAGDNSTQTQSGMLRRVNMGDQPMWDRYTLHGPGTFYIGSGPSSTDMVKFGQLERGQVVQLRADPRKRGVVDLTSVPPSPQQLNWWQKALDDLLSFASGNNASPLEEEIKSLFGIKPPQGNLYSLLDGRFARPTPPKPVAGRVKAYNVLVEVVNGDADTRIVAAGTPLRRWPL